MTKNPRNHNDWTNLELQEDSAGFLAAQLAFREDQEKERQEREYRDDLRAFTTAFVAAGGERKAAEPAFRAHLNTLAAREALQDAHSAKEQTRRVAFREV